MTTRRPVHLNPDTKPALIGAITITALLATVSFTLSFAGLAAIAPWAAVSTGLTPLFPIFIDGSILVYTYAALAARARQEGEVRAWAWLTLWTPVSVASNAAHAWDAGPTGWQGIIGATLAGLFPIGVLIATHTIADLVVEKPRRRPAPPLLRPCPHTVDNRPTGPLHGPITREEAIHEYRTSGLSCRDIAALVGVSKSAVNNYIRTLPHDPKDTP